MRLKNRKQWVLVLTLSLAVLCTAQEKDSLLIIVFHDVVSPAFRDTMRFPENGNWEFTKQLAFRISNSKVIDVFAKAQKTPIGMDLQQGIEGEQLRNDLSDLCESTRGFSRFMIGRLSDDSSTVAFADARVYKRYARNSTDDPLDLVIHVEGSRVDAYEKNQGLDEYLIEALLAKTEVGFDSRIRVLINPFKFYGDNEKLGHLGGMISALLGNRLSFSQRIRVIVPDTTANQQDRKRLLSSTLPEPGRQEGAKYVIGGSFFEYDNFVGIEASHIDVETGHTVLSKSVPLEAVNGPSFYEKVIGLADEIRRAIELDFDSKRNRQKLTVAVVASPPFPLTEDNKSMALDLASTLARKLRVLRSVNHNLEISLDESRLRTFCEQEVEPAVMAREMNAQILWVIRCDRPGGDMQISSEFFSVQHPNAPRKVVGPIVSSLANLSGDLDSTMRLVIEDPKNVLSIDSSSFESRFGEIRKIRVPRHPRTIAVVALPAYPSTGENKAIGLSIMHTISGKLRALQALLGDIKVISAESKLGEDYLDEELDRSSMRNLLTTDYLWTVEFEQAGHVRRLFMELVNQRNKYDTTYTQNQVIEHLDDLNEIVGSMSNTILKGWLDPADTSIALAAIEDVTVGTESGGIRLRGSILGFVQESKDLFLGNRYRSGLELSGIYYRLPMQYELSAAYDFGKREGDRLVYGRYVTLTARYNFMSVFGAFKLLNTRTYIGGGVSFLNVVRVKGVSGGQVKPGLALTIGAEVPFTRGIYLDINGQYVSSFSDVELGHFMPSDFRVGQATFASLGLGIGYRLQF